MIRPAGAQKTNQLPIDVNRRGHDMETEIALVSHQPGGPFARLVRTALGPTSSAGSGGPFANAQKIPHRRQLVVATLKAIAGKQGQTAKLIV